MPKEVRQSPAHGMCGIAPGIETEAIGVYPASGTAKSENPLTRNDCIS
jgi:hypothetical protein